MQKPCVFPSPNPSLKLHPPHHLDPRIQPTEFATPFSDQSYSTFCHVIKLPPKSMCGKQGQKIKGKRSIGLASA